MWATLLATLAIVALFAAGVFGVVRFLDSRVLSERTINPACWVQGSDMTHKYSPTQANNAALISALAISRGLPARAVTIALATAAQESRTVNIDYGDRDSVGLFQRRPSQGWGTVEQIMDPYYSSGKFYDALVRVDGYQDMEVTVAAQTVQRSAFPRAYAQHESASRLWASALSGYSSRTVSCELEPALPFAAGSASEIALDAVAARVHTDFPGLKITTHPKGGYVEVSTAGILNAARGADGFAQWAVMTAHETQVEAVLTHNSQWSRAAGLAAGSNAVSAWSAITDDSPDQVGTAPSSAKSVRLYLNILEPSAST